MIPLGSVSACAESKTIKDVHAGTSAVAIPNELGMIDNGGNPMVIGEIIAYFENSR